MVASGVGSLSWFVKAAAGFDWQPLYRCKLRARQHLQQARVKARASKQSLSIEIDHGLANDPLHIRQRGQDLLSANSRRFPEGQVEFEVDAVMRLLPRNGTQTLSEQKQRRLLRRCFRQR